MPTPSDHPIVSALANGIVREVHENRKAGLVRAALILMYCGIDQVAFLGLPAGVGSSNRTYFAQWVEKYMFTKGHPVLTGMDLYAARCALAHKYGSTSELHEAGKVTRELVYGIGGPAVAYYSPQQPGLVVVDVNLLVDAFIKGVSKFCDDVMNSDEDYRNAVNERLHTMLTLVPVAT
jgi:hypothetical protein